jgi:thiosulfate/3-mercaptopyruvate sulfurtransferase
MTTRLKNWLWAAIATVFLANAALAAGGPSALASVEWLQQNLGRDDVLLLDAQPGQMYAGKGHIPGAVNADVFSYAGRQLSPAEMEKVIQSWGVSPGKKIVVYDQGGTFFATSVFFDLYYHGFPVKDLVVLDGGIAKWQAAGGAVTKDPTPAPRPGTFRVAKVKEDVRARLPEFLVASGDPANNALVEALEPAQHYGAAKFFDRLGHIPNAVMTPSGDFYNADKTFKSPEEIRRMMDYLGVKPGQQLYAHCGGGIAATVPFFAAKFVLDYPKVKLYKESQLEWLRDDRGLPFWTYDAPNMTREKTWLSGWSNPMIRMFGVSKISIVDVRPEAAFRQSHIPFAVNVPADVFKRNLASPAKLAEALGAAGVDSSFEAVIVSDGGLNPNSALAYLMLEKIGQKRISVFADSVDDWAFAGLSTKEPPGPPIAATAYPADIRPGIVIADSQATQGVYPKVYLASGAALPAKVPEGKVIHVPYTELVTANGKPKEAKDIWGILVKAGVPRYAEIVPISDDPGEAAANYFILKLMGYPDVKVQVM